EQDKYLRKHKGEYAEAYAARSPWVNRIDLRFVQDFTVKAGQTKNTLQLSVDLLNAGNLLNSKWGVYSNNNISNKGAVLKYEGRDENNVPSFSMIKTGDEYLKESYSYYTHLSQIWRLQVGLRYIFN
ncbi:MAG: TonB-dependent receptor, partial [Bacteroidales bacterium]|nr:TonB-dependent receptor [Bacteroidales bacterium]